MLWFPVVPHEGTWIEMAKKSLVLQPVRSVVPHEGTWIEIKSYALCNAKSNVVPHEGTWIEIPMLVLQVTLYYSRSPRGNVD